MAKNAKLSNEPMRHPSMKWIGNDSLVKMVSVAPFGGKLSQNFKKCNPYIRHFWTHVAAFSMKHSEETTSFMAGVLSGGNIKERNGFTFAYYKGKTIDYLKKWGVPIYYESNRNKWKNYALISPFWPALFSIKMPIEVRDMWYNIKNAYKGKLYAAILWKVYASKEFAPNAIPYLQSRRTIISKFKTEDLSYVKKLFKLRVDENLTELHNGFKEMVQAWENK